MAFEVTQGKGHPLLCHCGADEVILQLSPYGVRRRQRGKGRGCNDMMYKGNNGRD